MPPTNNKAMTQAMTSWSQAYKDARMAGDRWLPDIPPDVEYSCRLVDILMEPYAAEGGKMGIRVVPTLQYLDDTSEDNGREFTLRELNTDPAKTKDGQGTWNPGLGKIKKLASILSPLLGEENVDFEDLAVAKNIFEQAVAQQPLLICCNTERPNSKGGDPYKDCLVKSLQYEEGPTEAEPEPEPAPAAPKKAPAGRPPARK